MYILTAVLLVVLTLLVRSMTRSTAASRPAPIVVSPADRAAQMAAQAQADMLLAQIKAPGSWGNAGRTDAAWTRLQRDRALNLERECAARAL